MLGRLDLDFEALIHILGVISNYTIIGLCFTPQAKLLNSIHMNQQCISVTNAMHMSYELRQIESALCWATQRIWALLVLRQQDLLCYWCLVYLD